MKSDASQTVGSDDTALAMGSGDLEVYATPAMAALMECAAMRLAAEGLTPEQTTVGSRLDIVHLRPTAIGNSVTATARLTAIDNRRLTFEVSASDQNGEIGHGTHERFIVERERFMSKCH